MALLESLQGPGAVLSTHCIKPKYATFRTQRRAFDTPAKASEVDKQTSRQLGRQPCRLDWEKAYLWVVCGVLGMCKDLLFLLFTGQLKQTSTVLIFPNLGGGEWDCCLFFAILEHVRSTTVTENCLCTYECNLLCITTDHWSI